MITLPRGTHVLRLSKALLALTLCYVLLVQALTAHHAAWTQTMDGVHQICLTDPDPAKREQVPDDRVPSHDGISTCCLIYGSSDVPRLQPEVSRFIYHVTLALYPTVEFLRPVDDTIDDPSARPRAPPLMG